MRPKFSIWSDYGASAQKHWMSAASRGTSASIGPKIFLAAVVVVATVIGISGIYPKVIDEAWVESAAGTDPPKMSPASADATSKPLGIVATIPPLPRRAVTVSQATVSTAGPAPAPELSQPRTSVPTFEPSTDTAMPPALGAIPDAEAEADVLPLDRAVAHAAKPANRPRGAVVKKNVVRVEHRQRSVAGPFAEYLQALTKLGRSKEVKAVLRSVL
jgi:hypothetical protein